LNHTQRHRRPYGITILRRRTAVVGSLCKFFYFNVGFIVFYKGQSFLRKPPTPF
jgi:hypothetical protein